MSRQAFQIEKPEPEKNERGLRYITEKYCSKLCEYFGGYEYPHLNARLYLHFQGFHKIENLEKFVNLQVLYLENNLIEKIENLEGLQYLTCLYLQNNYLTKIEGLEHNKNLVILNLSGNKIKKIENVSNLQKLENFYIEKNYLSSFEDLEELLELKSLTLLDIQSNRIESNSNEIINLLSQLNKLKVLYFKGNDVIREINNYRRTLIIKLRYLTYLDDRPVREEDRIGAEAYLKGGFSAEREAREKYRYGIEGQKKMLSEEERKKNKILAEERRKKNLENLRNAYEKRKNELEDKKRNLMIDYENHPDKRDKLTLQLQSIDYQLEENAKNRFEIEGNEGSKISNDENKKLFKYEKWMDDIFEREVIENYFDFNKALKLIKLDLAKKNVENIDLLSELDLRNKWTEFEFLKFRKDEDNNSYVIKKDDVLFEEEKRKKQEEEDYIKQKEEEERNKSVTIKIKEEEINEDDYNNNKKNEEDLDEIDTSSSKLIKKLQSNKDDLDAID